MGLNRSPSFYSRWPSNATLRVDMNHPTGAVQTNDERCLQQNDRRSYFLEWWGFVGTLVTLVGIAGTAIGLVFTYRQSKEAKTAAQEALAATAFARTEISRSVTTNLAERLKSLEGSARLVGGTSNREFLSYLFRENRNVLAELKGVPHAVNSGNTQTLVRLAIGKLHAAEEKIQELSADHEGPLGPECRQAFEALARVTVEFTSIAATKNLNAGDGKNP
jgi:hypothetical protein